MTTQLRCFYLDRFLAIIRCPRLVYTGLSLLKQNRLTPTPAIKPGVVNYHYGISQRAILLRNSPAYVIPYPLL